MVSAEENIAWLHTTQCRYVIGTPGTELCRYSKELGDESEGRQIGRLLERNSRPVARYSIMISEDPSVAAKVKLHWIKGGTIGPGSVKGLTFCAVISGSGLIKSCGRPKWWKTYIQLSDAEASFRIHKSDLCIRTIWHHKKDRIKAHILICFLAYGLWTTLQRWQSRAGLGDAPCTIRTELSRIHAADIVLHWRTALSESCGFVAWLDLSVSNNCSYNGSDSLCPGGCARPPWQKCSADF
jgi:hypothetical protein